MTSLELYLMLILLGVIVGVNLMIKIIRSLTIFHPPFFPTHSGGPASNQNSEGIGCFTLTIILLVLFFAIRAAFNSGEFKFKNLDLFGKLHPIDAQVSQKAAQEDLYDQPKYSASEQELETTPQLSPNEQFASQDGEISYDETEHGRKIWEGDETYDAAYQPVPEEKELTPDGNFFIQVQALQYENARRAYADWKTKTDKLIYLFPVQTAHGQLYRILIGPFISKSDAKVYETKNKISGPVEDYSGQELFIPE